MLLRARKTAPAVPLVILLVLQTVAGPVSPDPLLEDEAPLHPADLDMMPPLPSPDPDAGHDGHIILLPGEPVAHGGRIEAVLAEQADALGDLTALDPTLVVRDTFRTVLNGFHADLDPAAVPDLEAADYEVWPSRPVKGFLDESVPLIRADEVWQPRLENPLGSTGRGLTIAVIDTGVDYTHPDLGGCLGSYGCRQAWYAFADPCEGLACLDVEEPCVGTGCPPPCQDPFITDLCPQGLHPCEGDPVCGDMADPCEKIQGGCPSEDPCDWLDGGCPSPEELCDKIQGGCPTPEDVCSWLDGGCPEDVCGTHGWLCGPDLCQELQGVTDCADSRQVVPGCFGTGCKVIGGHDFVNADEDPYDDNGHGTHVAAIAAGDGHFRGVAPDAAILAYKVLDSGGRGHWHTVIAAIERAVLDEADVINLSLGGIGDPDDPVSMAVDAASAAGVVAVVAAGNYCYNGPYGNGFVSLCTPGAARTAISVTATTKAPEAFASFSSRGPAIWNGASLGKPDVAAPGHLICAARAAAIAQGAPSYPTCGPDHIELSGTSMAAPHVAGAAALLLETHGWSVEEVRQALKTTAVDVHADRGVGEGERQQDVGATVFSLGGGRIDVMAAEAAAPQEATLSPVAMDGWPDVAGNASGPWSLQYQRFDAPLDAPWIDLAQGPPGPFAVDLSNVLPGVPDGRHVLRLVVDGGVDHGVLHVDKSRLVAPWDADIRRLGDVLDVRVEVRPDLQPAGMRVWQGAVAGYHDEPTSWSLVADTPTLEAAWDTAGLQPGQHRLRVEVAYNGSSEVDVHEVWLQLDGDLAPGWPVRLPLSPCKDAAWGGSCGERAVDPPGPLHPLSADLTGDGRQEIVVWRGGAPTTLFVYDADGNELWNRSQGQRLEVWETPVLADLTGDGRPEIVAGGAVDDDDQTAVLYAYTGNGSEVPGWPVELTVDDWLRVPTIGAGDLTGDGKDEVVAAVNVPSDEDRLFVVDGQGNVTAAWTIHHSTTAWLASSEQPPQVVDLTGDGENEIVFADRRYEETGVWVFDQNGTLLPGWPVGIDGTAWQTLTVGDRNGDGEKELFITHSDWSKDWQEWGGIKVYGPHGSLNDHLRPGLTVGGPNILLAPLGAAAEPSLLLQRSGTQVLDGAGETRPGWPNDHCTIFGMVIYGRTGAYDLTGDGANEVVTRAQDWFCMLVDVNDGGAGGVYAWDAAGDLLPGFPKITESRGDGGIALLDAPGGPTVVATSTWDYWVSDTALRPAAPKDRATIYAWSP